MSFTVEHCSESSSHNAAACHGTFKWKALNIRLMQCIGIRGVPRQKSAGMGRRQARHIVLLLPKQNSSRGLASQLPIKLVCHKTEARPVASSGSHRARIRQLCYAHACMGLHKAVAHFPGCSGAHRERAQYMGLQCRQPTKAAVNVLWCSAGQVSW